MSENISEFSPDDAGTDDVDGHYIQIDDEGRTTYLPRLRPEPASDDEDDVEGHGILRDLDIERRR
jgi:hypothetical protein